MNDLGLGFSHWKLMSINYLSNCRVTLLVLKLMNGEVNYQ